MINVAPDGARQPEALEISLQDDEVEIDVLLGMEKQGDFVRADLKVANLGVVVEHPGIPRLAKVSLAFEGPQNYIGRAEMGKHAVERPLSGVIAQELHDAAAAQARIIIDTTARVVGDVTQGFASDSIIGACHVMEIESDLFSDAVLNVDLDIALASERLGQHDGKWGKE
jgi:hypothetical protein